MDSNIHVSVSTTYILQYIIKKEKICSRNLNLRLAVCTNTVPKRTQFPSTENLIASLTYAVLLDRPIDWPFHFILSVRHAKFTVLAVNSQSWWDSAVL